MALIKAKKAHSKTQFKKANAFRRNLRCILLAMALASTKSAASGSTELVERLVYINSKLVGYFDICMNEAGEAFLPESFFERVTLRKNSSALACKGRSYWKTNVRFVRNDARNTLTGEAVMDDYVSEKSSQKDNLNDRASKPINNIVNAFALQHALGLWHDTTGNANATLGISAREYTTSGLFGVDAYLAADKTQGFNHYITNVSWKRDFPSHGISAAFGLNSIALAGNGVRIYGLIFGSNQNQQNASAAQSIDGFAETPGRIQVRVGGTLVKDVPVSAGYFSISTASLPQTSGASGNYSLSLIDDSGRLVRTWDVFVPIGAQLLRAGGTDWKVFSGQIETQYNSNKLVSGPRNLGSGVSYKRGLSTNVTAEISAFAAERAKGAGVALSYAPYPWLSMTGGTSKQWGDIAMLNSFGGVDLHSEHLGASASYQVQQCSTGYVFSSQTCANLRLQAYLYQSTLGRLQWVGTTSVGGSPRSSSIGLNWSLPNIGRINLSIYGTRQTYVGARASVSAGLLASIPFGNAQLTTSVNVSNSNSSAYSTAYSTTDVNNNQYLIGADVNKNSSDTSSLLRASVTQNPWFGSYQFYAQMSPRSGGSVAFNETGAVLYTQSELLLSKQSDDGFAVIRLAELPNISLTGNTGTILGVTNSRGYAAIPRVYGGQQSLDVSADEVPDDIRISRPLVDIQQRQWSATAWHPTVKRVKHGWIRLVLPDGTPVKLGSFFKFSEINSLTYVLEDGSTYIDDLPAGQNDVDIHYPGNVSRCTASIPEKIRLEQNLSKNLPSVICNPSFSLGRVQ